MSATCFLCGIDTDDQLSRSPLPKELLDKTPDGQLAEDLQPICKACNDFKRVVDNSFIRLCEEAKLFEWFRSNSKRQSEYFPATFIYHIDVDELREFYYYVMTVCETAYRKNLDPEYRKGITEELNYMWRKKDE